MIYHVAKKSTRTNLSPDRWSSPFKPPFETSFTGISLYFLSERHCIIYRFVGIKERNEN